MKALQRLNTLYFLVGYLGFVATWVLDLVASIMHPPHLGDISAALQAGLRWVSPHFCFARGVYDVQNTYQAGEQCVGGGVEMFVDYWDSRYAAVASNRSTFDTNTCMPTYTPALPSRRAPLPHSGPKTSQQPLCLQHLGVSTGPPRTAGRHLWPPHPPH
jgi:hypothetical protein